MSEHEHEHEHDHDEVEEGLEQALELDQVLLIHSEFGASKQGLNLNWTLLFIPSRESLHELAASLARLESRGPH